MDPRLNLALLEAQQEELARQVTQTRLVRGWPDHAKQARPIEKRRPLHPIAALGTLLTQR